MAEVTGAADLAAIVDGLLRSRERLLERNPAEIATALSTVVEGWLSPGSAWMAQAVDAACAESGFSTPMVRAYLPTMIEPLRGAALADLVERELGGWAGLEDFRTPRLTLHVLPSNLPGHAAIPTAVSLLSRSAVLLKPGRSDRAFAGLWVDSIRSADPEIGRCVASCYWRGGDRRVEDVVLERADLVVASGGDRAIEDLRSRCPGSFVGHGHRVSLAVVCRDAERRAAARSLAADVAAWDQLGCLSPQVCFVEGDTGAARGFARAVADELRALSRRLPPGWIGQGELLESRRFREAAEWKDFASTGRHLFAVSDVVTDGCVVVEDDLSFTPTPLHRCVRVVAVSDVGEVAGVVSQHGSTLEAAGVAISSAAFAAVRDRLNRAGVPHVVRLGAMQRPTLQWEPGGRSRLTGWTSES